MKLAICSWKIESLMRFWFVTYTLFCRWCCSIQPFRYSILSRRFDFFTICVHDFIRIDLKVNRLYEEGQMLDLNIREWIEVTDWSKGSVQINKRRSLFIKNQVNFFRKKSFVLGGCKGKSQTERNCTQGKAMNGIEKKHWDMRE